MTNSTDDEKVVETARTTRVCSSCGETKSISDDFIQPHHVACRVCVLRSNARRKDKIGEFARRRLRQLGVNVHYE